MANFHIIVRSQHFLFKKKINNNYLHGINIKLNINKMRAECTVGYIMVYLFIFKYEMLKCVPNITV